VRHPDGVRVDRGGRNVNDVEGKFVLVLASAIFPRKFGNRI